MNKILYLADYGDIKGGGEVSLIELVKNLDRTKFRPVVVLPSKGSMGGILKSLNIPFYIIPLPSLRGYKNLYVPEPVAKLISLVKKEGINLIHSNSPRSGIYGGFTARLLKLPNTCHIRTANPEPRVDKLLAGLTTKIIAVSQYVAQRFKWLAPLESSLLTGQARDKIAVVYNGVDTQRFSPVGADSICDSNLSVHKDFVVGTVGQLLPYKGHKTLISAANKVIGHTREIKFLIVGDERKRGYKKELQEEVRRLGIGDYVCFEKFRADIPDVLNALSLFVFPAIKEHFGRVVIEAMACGKPVIATRSGGIPEIVVHRETGILIPPEDLDALKDAILELFQNREERENFGISGRKRVEQMFDIKLNVRNIQAIYDKVLG